MGPAGCCCDAVAGAMRVYEPLRLSSLLAVAATIPAHFFSTVLVVSLAVRLRLLLRFGNWAGLQALPRVVVVMPDGGCCRGDC
ncbi:hypothetical protein L3X38_042431 [Prunus dulcis]|uniref:Uncharacterized protein n=1 Tax=Prunus dulcis TaxID=3755 RepID=A0AAD4UWL3_PRUDU|nr:hypothetical protein L3X38_042431 [Prunus dulcis]